MWFAGGPGANAVHEESSELINDTFFDILQRGENVVLPKVGARDGSIRTLIETLKAEGYAVNLVLVDVPGSEAWRRSIGRFEATGRLVPPQVMQAGIDGAPRTYDILKAEGIADAYVKIDNTPAIGQPRVIVEDSAGIIPDDIGRAGSNRSEDDIKPGRAVDGGPQGEGGLNPDSLPGDAAAPGSMRVPAAARRIADIVDREPGKIVSNMLDGITPAEKRWLKAEYAAGRLERQSDPVMQKIVRYRRPMPDSDAGWQREFEDMPERQVADLDPGSMRMPDDLPAADPEIAALRAQAADLPAAFMTMQVDMPDGTRGSMAIAAEH